VLVTCDKDNVASARIIRHNGGMLDSESPSPTDGMVKQRYWIDLQAADAPGPRGKETHRT